MKHLSRILILAVVLFTGITTVSAQTIQVLVVQKVPSLPAAATNYLEDPFRYFDVRFIVNGAGSDGLDIFFDMEFSLNEGSFYLRTKRGTVPSQSIHVNEGVNIMSKDVLLSQLRNGRKETNVDLSSPLDAQLLPEGTYQLCMDIYLWSDKDNPGRIPISFGPCPSYQICYSGSAPELVSPMAGAQLALNGSVVVTPTRKVNFMWTPAISNCAGARPRFTYRLKVVKVLDGQNYNDAIKINPTVFAAEVRNNTYTVLDTLRDIKVLMEKGALYVAQVQAEQINSSMGITVFQLANDGYSQPLPFYWGTPAGGVYGGNSGLGDNLSRSYTTTAEVEEGDDDRGEATDGMTDWEGGIKKVSELDGILEDALPDEIVVIEPKRHYVESDGYYTIPMADDIEVGLIPARHQALKNTSFKLALYDYRRGGVDSITAYQPLFSEKMDELPETRTLSGWGSKLKQGNLYYLQLSDYFTVKYRNYTVADTLYYVNDMLAEHFHDTVSLEHLEEAMMYSDGVFFQWGDDPDAPDYSTPQWTAPVDRSYYDVYDPANYKLPASMPVVQMAKTFPVSWTPAKDVNEWDQVEYEVTVYELKPGQTLNEAISDNEELISLTVSNASEIANDAKFFKVFSSNKTYVMTLSTDVDSETRAYHFRNGNKAIPIVFKVVK